MEYFDNTLCVTCEELTSGDDPVMKYITLYQNVRRGNIESVNRGGGEGNVALYSYSSLPEKYKQRWVARHGEQPSVAYTSREGRNRNTGLHCPRHRHG